jgi:tetratricopeptide (TPR) repeat protein
MTVEALGLAPRDRPFAGPRPFGPEDADRFFGRSEEIAEVAGLWRARRVTVITGPSGAGLTSLLAAGVIPLLNREDVDVLPIGRAAATVIPFVAPAGRNPMVSSLLSSWAPPGERDRSADPGRTISAFLRSRASGAPVLAAIDQAEDLLTAPALHERHLTGLVAGLAEALRDHPRLHLLLAVRDAYRPAIQPYAEQLSREAPAGVRLGFLTPDAAIEAVRRPLETTDREFAPDAAEYLIDELGLPPSLDTAPTGDGLIAPTLLQVCCARIWSRVPADVRSIGIDHIRAYAGVDRSLRDFVTRVLGETAAQHRIDVNSLRTWLQRTFAGRGEAVHAVTAGAAQAANIDESLLRTLENRHLLRSEAGPGGLWYALYHQRVAQPLGQVPGAFTAPDYLRSAELALAAGELDLADKHVAEALAAARRDDRRLRADAERLLGDIAAERGRPETAEEHYLSAATLLESLQDTEGVGLLLAAIGRLQLARGLRQKAFDKLRAAADRLPTDPSVNILLARALWSMGQRQAAVGVLTGLLAANEDAPDALRTRGEFLADLGEAQRALHDLDRVRLNPRPVARAARALALATLDDGDHARDEIAEALAEAPGNGQVLLYAARVAELGGDHDTAAERAERALSAIAPPLLRHQRDEASRLLDQIRAR